ncbi:MAG: hypothetical protein ACMUIP_09965 [bacterium]
MIIQIDEKHLAQKWRKRALDLFPGLQSLKILFLFRKAYINECQKKLKQADNATLIQFLSSDDQKVYELAKAMILENRASKEEIIDLILYSLDKVTKEVYPFRLAELIADYDVVFCMGSLIGYLFLRPDLRGIIVKIFAYIEIIANQKFQNTKDFELLISEVFDSIEDDLKQRLPETLTIKSLQELEKINNHLELMVLLCIQRLSKERTMVIEKRISYIGSALIGSLQKIEFSYDDPEQLYIEFKKVIPYMGILRLKEDYTFLKELEEKVHNAEIGILNDKEIISMIECALKSIENPDLSILNIVKNRDFLSLSHEMREYQL